MSTNLINSAKDVCMVTFDKVWLKSWEAVGTRSQESCDIYRRKEVGQVGCVVLLHVADLHWNRTEVHELLKARKKKCHFHTSMKWCGSEKDVI